MKKNIFRMTLVAAFAAIAGYNVYASQQDTKISDLAKANVEALASGEVIIGPWHCVGDFNVCLHDEQGIILGLKQYF